VGDQKTGGWKRAVFANCPFDQDYKDLFSALVFAVHDCGFYVRCALEIEAGALRFQTICDLIRACRYGNPRRVPDAVGPGERFAPVQHAFRTRAFPRRARVWPCPEVAESEPRLRQTLEQERAEALSIQSSNRFVDPKDIAALAVFLASDGGKSISGQMLPIDNDTLKAS